MGETLRQAVSTYIAERRSNREFSASTIKTVTHTLRTFADVGPATPGQLQRQHITRWLDSQKVSDATLASRYGTVKAFCRWLVITRRLLRDPTLTIKGPKRPRRRPRALPAEQAQRVLDAAAHDPRLRAAVSLMLLEGLRLAETAGLQVGDFDLDRGVLYVLGKGNQERMIPLTRQSAAAVRDYLATSPVSSGPLLRSMHDDRSPITPAHLGRVVTGLFRACGVKSYNRDGRSPHALRHTAATDTLAAGAHIDQVRDLLGHQNVATTQIYLAPTDAEALRPFMEARTYAPPLRAVASAR